MPRKLRVSAVWVRRGILGLLGLGAILWTLTDNPYWLENPIRVWQQPSDEVVFQTLPSVRKVDYQELRSLLQSQQWEAADQETGRILFEELSLRRSADIRHLPCTDLHTLDRLWITASKGRFGFSVQQHIVEADSQLPTPEELQKQCSAQCQDAQCKQGCLAKRIRTQVTRIPTTMGRGQPALPANSPLPEGYYPSWGIYWGDGAAFLPQVYTYQDFAGRAAQCRL